MISHFLTESEGQTWVTHQIEMTGPLAFVFAYLPCRSCRFWFFWKVETRYEKMCGYFAKINAFLNLTWSKSRGEDEKKDISTFMDC